MVAVQPVREERIVLHHVSWDTYEHLVQDHANASTPRFTYDRGTLEIMSPLSVHERYSRFFDLFMAVLAEETDTEVRGFGSTTFKREDLQQGFEADACFYVQQAHRVRGKDDIDLRTDPPPDLIVEIDVTHSSLDKLPIVAQVGVPEAWRYNGERLQFWVLAGGHYESAAQSRVLPLVTVGSLEALLRQGKGLDYAGWMRRVRRWVRDLSGKPGL